MNIFKKTALFSIIAFSTASFEIEAQLNRLTRTVNRPIFLKTVRNGLAQILEKVGAPCPNLIEELRKLANNQSIAHPKAPNEINETENGTDYFVADDQFDTNEFVPMDFASDINVDLDDFEDLELDLDDSDDL